MCVPGKELTTEEWKEEKRKKKAQMTAMQALPYEVNCECGGRFRYMTNMEEPIFDVNCLNCGAPVAIQWNEKKKIYETVQR